MISPTSGPADSNEAAWTALAAERATAWAVLAKHSPIDDLIEHLDADRHMEAHALGRRLAASGVFDEDPSYRAAISRLRNKYPRLDEMDRVNMHELIPGGSPPRDRGSDSWTQLAAPQLGYRCRSWPAPAKTNDDLIQLGWTHYIVIGK